MPTNIHYISIYYIFFNILFIVSSQSTCTDLAVCALDKCINNTNYLVLQPPKIIPDLLNRTDFSCVLGNDCFRFCENCDSCYKSLIEDKSKGIYCRDFKECAQSCMKENRLDPFPCIFRKRCIKYCLDDINCPSGYDMIRRIFTGFCYRRQLREVFLQPCRTLFDTLALDYRLRH